MRNYGAKERAFMAAAFLVFAVLGAVSARSLGETVYFLAAFALLFSAALFDGVRGRIPTMVPAALSALSFGAAFFVCAPLPSGRVFGFCFGLAVPLLVRALWLQFRREEGLGMGDVKLLAALGLLCGGRVIAVLLLGSVFLAAESLVLRQRELPFAPALCLAAAGVLAASFKMSALKKLRYGCTLFLLAMAFIPLVIAGAKKATNVYCPYQVTLYGGENPYVKVLSRYPPDYDFTVHKRGHCFPAGHASGGFALMILFFCFKKKKYKIAGLCLGLAAGWGMGLYQMWRGEHFLSHTLCTLFAAWLMCLLLAAFMERVQKKYPAFFAFCGPK